MKKVLSVLLTVSIILLFGCSKFNDSSITVINDRTHNEEPLDLSDANVILSILDSGKWESYLTKTACNYRFIIDEETTIYYCDSPGLFSDRENERTLFISDDEKEQINEIVYKLVESNRISDDTEKGFKS